MHLLRAPPRFLSKAVSETTQTSHFHRLASMSKRGPKRANLEEQGILSAKTKLPGSGFTVESIEYVKEFDVTLVQFRHDKTGAYFLHVDTDDTNNAFGVTFRTPAKESTGVAHILEHVVLCGSEKYPVRDPFFKMLKRSMNTYMNAMTAQDYTMYPFSTVVEQDFHNLLGVYLDASFFPLIKETDFLQEGHRLELIVEGAKRLKRTGVVYNEMKGHLSDSSSLYSARLQEELFGDSVFGHNSGGDWKRIPQLTYQRLVEFHKSHYHPSNCLFVSYGDLPITKTLEQVDTLVLSRFSYDEKFEKQSLNEISLKLQTPKRKDVEMVVPAENDSDLDKFKVSRAWVVDDFDCNDAYKTTVGRVLSSLLLDGPQAPVYSSLIDAQIAPQFAPTTGFDVSSFSPTFSIGAQGALDVVQAEQAIAQGIDRACREGFSQDRVNAVIHQMELSVRHKRANFGLSCVMASAQSWAHGGPRMLSKSFHVTKLIDELKRNSTPEYWKGLVIDWVARGWDNYQVRLVASPSKTRSKEDLDWEEAELEKIKLQPEEERHIQTQALELARERETPEDISLLPTLNVSKDVPLVTPEAIRVVSKQGRMSEREIQQVLEQKTNGVTYLRSFFDFKQTFEASPDLQDLKPLLPLMCSALGAVDAGKRSYKELDLALELTAGTLSVSPSLPVWLGVEFTPKHKQGEMSEGVLVTLDCLTPNAPKAYEDILGDVLSQSLFATDDGRRLQALLATSAQSATTSLTSDASKYAKRLARASQGRAFALEETYHGLHQVKLIQRASQTGLEGAKRIAQALQILSLFTFSAKTSGTRASFVDVSGESIDPIDKFLSRLDGSKVKLPTNQDIKRAVDDLKDLGVLQTVDEPPARATYLSLPVPVHYCSAVFRTDVPYGHVDDAALNVLAQLASYDYLHQHVREKGGAYGAGASFDQFGMFSMSSFWDPNSVKTLETFDLALKWLCDAKFSEKQVDEALLSIFASLDAPANPGSKGMAYFLQGITSEMRDAQREKYFDLVGSTGIAKLRDVAQRHLTSGQESFVKVVGGASGDGKDTRISVCVAGKQDTATQEFSKMEGWKIIAS